MFAQLVHLSIFLGYVKLLPLLQSNAKLASIIPAVLVAFHAPQDARLAKVLLNVLPVQFLLMSLMELVV